MSSRTPDRQAADPSGAQRGQHHDGCHRYRIAAPTAAALTSVAGPVAIENPSVRVYKWAIAPGTATAMHTHTRPYLIVAATPMQLKMTAPDAQSRSERVKAGDFHWVNVPVTHSLANEGSGEGLIVEFELK